jgi:hypothetical protein
MTKTNKAKWTAAAWVEGECDDLMDSYGNDDRADQMKFILESLRQDIYRDELTDRQVAAAIKYITRKA